MLDVLTVGSATKDIFLVSKEFQIITSDAFATGKGECVSFGSKIDIEKAVITTGGGGTNAAATFAQLGFKTAVITRIGHDSAGRDIIEELKRYGVKPSLVQRIEEEQTGLGVQLMTRDGERSVLVHRGASASFSKDDIPWNKLRAKKWIYMTSLAGNLSLALRIAKQGDEQGCNIAFNPGSKELSQGMRAFEPILRHLRLFNLNKEEAQQLTKSKEKDASKLCAMIAQPGMIVVVTDGPNGAYAYKDGETWFVRPSNAKAVSRTGAGDAFGSGLVAALADDRSIDEALAIGVANAESVIQSYGAKAGILSKWPDASELQQYTIRKIN